METTTSPSRSTWSRSRIRSWTRAPCCRREVHTNQNGSVAIADFNGDGALDVGLGNFPGTGALFGIGNGTFGPFVGLESSGFRIRSVFAHDFDHDGFPDLAVAGSPIAVWRGAATSPSAEQRSIPVVREALQLDARDVNGDGAPDLITRFSDGVVLYPELAAWQFGSPFFLASGTRSINPGFWVADLNGDRIADVMVRRQSTLVWFVSDP